MYLRLGRFNLKIPIVCASVIAEDMDSMDENIDKALMQGADAIEIRLDGLRDTEGWKCLLRSDVPTIVTNRAEREGGYFQGKEEERVNYLAMAAREGASCIDIELSTPKKYLNRALDEVKERDTVLLISYHNFDRVPSVENLLSISRQMIEWGCDLAKLIGFARRPDDISRTFDFLLRASDEVEVPVVSFAMGKAGKLTRIAAPIFGSPIVYVSVIEEVAPGQIDISTTKEILAKLRVKFKVENLWS